ncbi:hypothetical protein [Chondrinema litorale]|uniref:hypothetical protein n=1 Tax=Chondrinema litorale TaxID=2994555 RepID=UPI0025433FE8|nr:hypothetical protein [Chondrinema litorale]UZR96160.1 hypothetical protein OQ292_10110 [Chondrinema litorale]
MQNNIQIELDFIYVDIMNKVMHMQKFQSILIAIILLWSCQESSHEEADHTLAQDSVTVKVPQVSLSDSVSKTPQKINKELPITLKTLADFEKNGQSRAEKANDSLFVAFLNAFTSYENSLNEGADYDDYISLVYSSDEEITPKAIAFRDSVKQLGFSLGASEGYIFLKKDSAFLAQFYPYLSKRMNIFLHEYSTEIERPFSNDAGIIVSIDEHVRRMLFWDAFYSENPDFELPDYAKNEFEKYLFYLMFGMENTPVYDNLKYDTVYLEVYRNIVENYPTTTAASYLSEYLELIEQNDFIFETESINEYRKSKTKEFLNY